MIFDRVIKTFLQSRSIRPDCPEQILKSMTDRLRFLRIRRRAKLGLGAPATGMIPMISAGKYPALFILSRCVRTIKGLIYFV